MMTLILALRSDSLPHSRNRQLFISKSGVCTISFQHKICLIDLSDDMSTLGYFILDKILHQMLLKAFLVSWLSSSNILLNRRL